MASVDFELLDQALADGAIAPHLPGRKYVTRSVNALNSILGILRSDPGIDLEQIAARSGLSYSSVKVYCQWAKERGVLNFKEEGGRHVHFLGKLPDRHQDVARKIVAALEPISHDPPSWNATWKGNVYYGVREALKLATQLL